jgi:hypothetical protein
MISLNEAAKWKKLLRDVKGEIVYNGLYSEERIFTKDLILRWLSLTPGGVTSGTYRNIANAMRELGWTGRLIRLGGGVQRGYTRLIKKEAVGDIWEPYMGPIGGSDKYEAAAERFKGCISGEDTGT